MDNRWSRLPLWARLCAIVLLFACVVGALEMWAKEQRLQLPGWGGPTGATGLMTAHPTRLWGMSPGIKPNAEDSQASINELGFRGPLPDRPKPNDRLRVISLGDSSFYGFGVNDSETFDVHLVDLLRDEGLNIDSVNAGVAGYSIAQHRVAMDETIWDLEPNLLVLCNVWSDNTWDTFHDEDLLVSSRFAQRNPLTRSALVKWIASWMGSFQSEGEGRIIVWNGSEGWPEGKVRRVPLKRWIELHHEILVEASRRGVGTVFLKPTNSYLLSSDQFGPPPGWTPYFEAMNALANHHHIPVVDVSLAYRSAMEQGVEAKDLLWDKMHPTALGHGVLAEAIRAELRDNGWPQTALVPTGTTLPKLNLQDVPNPEWTDDAGAGSPQISLFELSNEEKAAMEQARKLMEQRGPPEPETVQQASGSTSALPSGQPPFVPSPMDRTAEERVQPTMWSVEISVSGGAPPYAIQLLDEAGRVVGSARVKEPKTFRLNVRQDVTDVKVSVIDASGQAAQQTATPSSAVVDVSLES